MLFKIKLKKNTKMQKKKNILISKFEKKKEYNLLDNWMVFFFKLKIPIYFTISQ